MTTKDELQYSPTQHDYIEGVAQDLDTTPDFPSVDESTTITIGEDDKPASQALARFLTHVTPLAVIQMVRVIRRLKYLLECAHKQNEMLIRGDDEEV
jgi:hypothetical protein